MESARRIALVALDNSKLRSWGGKHVHQELLELGLTESGWAVFPVYPTPGPAARWSGLGWRLRIKKWLPPLHFLYFRWDILRRISFLETKLASVVDQNVDSISCQDVPSAIAAIAIRDRYPRRNLRIVLTLHGYFGRESADSSKPSRWILPWWNRFCWQLEAKALRGVDAVVAVDSRLRDWARDEHAFGGPTTVLHNAVDTERFSPPSAAEMRKLRAELGWPAAARILFVPRRLVRKNGVAIAIEALRNVRADTLLAIGGEGPEEPALKAQARELGVSERVLWLGAIHHAATPKYFRACDAVLIPSISVAGIEEATSLAMLEGFACGKAVIASRIGGLEEVMAGNSIGRLVSEKDPAALAEAIEECLAGPLSERGTRVVREFYAYQRWAKTFSDFILAVPAGGRRRLALLGAAQSAHLIRLSNALAAQGWAVSLFTQHDFEAREYRPEIGVHRLRFSGVWGYFMNAWELRRALQAARVELLDVHFIGGYGLLGALSGFPKRLSHVWGSDVVGLSAKSVVRRRSVRRILSSSRLIVATSGYLAEELKRETGIAGRVIPFGVDTEEFQRTDSGGFQVLCPKEMAAVYNQEFLLGVLQRLTETSSREKLRRRGFVLGLTGAANAYRDRLMRKARDLGVEEFVRFDGQVAYREMPRYLGGAAVVVLPSLRESFGVAALEAGAAEVPVLAHRTGGLREIVLDGETGWLLPLDAGLWAEKLDRLMSDEDLRRRLGSNGRRRVRKNFEIRNTAALLSSNYHGLL